MKRLIASAGVAFICAAAVLTAQGSINQEPHHKRVLYTNDLRMFDVTIPPGDATTDHVHEYDVATLVLGDGTLQIQRNGVAAESPAAGARGGVIDAEHTGAPTRYRIANSGTTDYHVIEVENLREGGGWPASHPVAAPATTVLQDTRAFTIYDVRLTAGAPETTHAHPWPTVVILIDGAVEAGGIGGEEPVRLQKSGQWMFLPRELSHTLTTVGDTGAHVVEIEVR
jgi:quercetin dioxygenase-like cupin family protein